MPSPAAPAADPPTKAKRGRKPTETRTRLIESAITLFARHGYDGVAVDMIASDATINKQLVYHYFGNKAGLFRAALQECYMRYRGDDTALEKLADNPDPLQAIRDIAGFLFGRGPEMLRFQRMLQDANIQGQESFEGLEGVQSAYARLIAIIAGLLDRGEAMGLVREGIDPVEFYISLAGICGARVSNALTLSHVLQVDLISPEGARKSQQNALDFLLYGITEKAG